MFSCFNRIDPQELAEVGIDWKVYLMLTQELKDLVISPFKTDVKGVLVVRLEFV